MKLLLLVLLSCANAFIGRTVLLKKKLFSNNADGEPSKISIKSVTDLFNAYLEAEKQTISDTIVVPPRPQSQPKKTEVEKATIVDKHSRLTDIHCNMKRQHLLKVLQNDKTSQQTKLEYIDDTKWLFDQQYGVNMSNGGLMDDWNFTL
jgi:hypothetical protein